METKTKPKVEKPKEVYSFDEVNHIHKFGDKPLMGVTTVLSVISKPALIQWSASIAADYIEKELRENCMKVTEGGGEEILVDGESLNITCKEAKVAHRVKKETAGDFGTILHTAIENYIKTGEAPEDLSFEGLQGFVKFMFWANKEKVKFLESEKHVWSKELWVGGICDGILTLDGKKYLFDVKTSSGIYPTMFAQMAAYHLCLKEMKEHEDIAGYLIVNLNKQGKMDLAMSNNMDFNQTFFKNALALYKSNQEADKMKLVKE